MFWLICVTVNIQNVLLSLECRQETSTPLITAIVNNHLFQSNSYINQMPPQIVHILCFFSGRLAAPYFIMKYILSRLFGSQKSGSSCGSVTLLHFRTGGSEWRAECQGWQSSRKR